MPANAQSERSDAAGGSSSKTSLLWAYQLRREHVHLVERIDGMDFRLVSCTNKTETHEQNLANLETLVRSLQAENYTVKNEVTLMRTKLATRIENISQQISAIVNDGAMKDATEKLETGVRDMGLQVSELSNRMSEFKADIAKVTTGVTRNIEHQEPRQTALESRQDNLELKKTEPEPVQIETKPRLLVMLQYKKQKARTRQSMEALTEVINTPDSIIDQAGLSTLTDSYVPDFMPLPANDHTLQLEAISREIRQGARSLNDYFVFTSQLRCQLPRRKQEGHIVEAFFDGITSDDGFKTSLEEYLNEFGWVWSNLEIFCKPRALRKKRKPIYNIRSKTKGNAHTRGDASIYGDVD
ncbi:hypothetical protein UA08_06748 [Talaromyces atroroseus]|uniref:Uncharacterized protein n=1 Tax=Talaromyces atroroseus TaxID=1441469 RepID=A0A225ATM8_TALAT|nr:hypothetical protein UA08_06748 [Talaromyces atroroseus]OKL58286.1 hypothetical protein UA08_06748 [Talaromyces atroroseus]